MDNTGPSKVKELQERRARIADQRERAEKKRRLGNEIAFKLGSALGLLLIPESFDEQQSLPTEFIRRPNFTDCPGLVSAHIGEARAREILVCGEEKLGPMEGFLSCDEYAFMGVARVGLVRMSALLDAAKALHDSVMFCPAGSASIILVDHYRLESASRDFGFSIVVQGSRLESKLSSCFDNVIQLSRPAD